MDNFEDCFLTEEDRQKKIKEELDLISYYDDCAKNGVAPVDNESYEDCILTEEDKQRKIREELELIEYYDSCAKNGILPVDNDYDDYEDCRKR